jgi:hypothetical protein
MSMRGALAALLLIEPRRRSITAACLVLPRWVSPRHTKATIPDAEISTDKGLA